MTLSGQVALITGGAKNLGAEIALQLAPLGASLALHYNSAKTKADADKLEKTLKETSPHTKVSFYPGDLTTAGAVDDLFKQVLKDFGKVDIVINTVGMVLKKPISDISEEEYDAMFAYDFLRFVPLRVTEKDTLANAVRLESTPKLLFSS